MAFVPLNMVCITLTVSTPYGHKFWTVVDIFLLASQHIPTQLADLQVAVRRQPTDYFLISEE